MLFAYAIGSKSETVAETSRTAVKTKDGVFGESAEKQGKSVKTTTISLRNLCDFPYRNIKVITE